MFLDDLANSLLLICGEKKYSYETAAELCGISRRYFGKIVCKKAVPSIAVLEGMCSGLEKTPNELLGVRDHVQDHVISYRISLPVTEVSAIEGTEGTSHFPICPKCSQTLDRELTGNILSFAVNAGNAWIGVNLKTSSFFKKNAGGIPAFFVA